MNHAKALLAGALTSMLLLCSASPLQADMVGTRQLLSADARAEQETQVRQFLSREDVRQQLEAMGVDAQAAQDRVAALTDSELQQLSQNIATAPAAGDAGVFVVLGVVFLVLLVLDLTGIIHIFRH
jgi:hypothetical protein